tara:strand:- start:427 stop:1257 length:831 start_codon:yes stop_codon:yes gene_type:complete
MNSKFYITLKKVRFKSELYPLANEDLSNHLNHLISFINEGENQINPRLKEYVRAGYNEITEQQLVFEKHHKKLRDNDIKKMSLTDIDKLQIELDYYSEILNTCDDARVHLLEYLANYYPELLEHDEIKVILKQLLPFSKIAKKLLQNENSIDKNKSISNIVESFLSFMLEEDMRIHRQIIQEKDYDNLIEIVTKYFDSNCEVPKINQSIKKVYTSKGNIVWAFKTLFKNIYPISALPDSLFILLKKCFYEYRDDKIDNLKKTRRPEYFDETINKNK